MTRKVAIVTVFALLGCATADPIKLPNGQMGYSIACDGGANRWSHCYEKAAALCPAGYDLITQNGETRPVLVTTAPGMYTGGAMVDREMMIQCKTADSPH
jgi:hypothetical protein